MEDRWCLLDGSRCWSDEAAGKPSSNHLWCKNLNPITEHVWPWTARNMETAEQDPILSQMPLKSDKWKYDEKEISNTVYYTMKTTLHYSLWQLEWGISECSVLEKGLISSDLQHLINFKPDKNATPTPFHCFQLCSWLIWICAQSNKHRWSPLILLNRQLQHA